MKMDAVAQERIEPNTIRRRGVGLRGHDAARAFPGFTRFAPDGKPDRKTVYLIDMQGTVAHTWERSACSQAHRPSSAVAGRTSMSRDSITPWAAKAGA